MPKDGKKVAIGAGVVTVLVGTIALTRKAKAAPPEIGGVTIQIFDKYGNPVPTGSPAILTEGETGYRADVTVNNLSTKKGEPWEATLITEVVASVDGISLIDLIPEIEYFAAGESKIFSFTFDVPLGAGGLAGNISAIVKDPTGVTLDSAVELLTIEEVPIIYGAGIVIGV